MNRGEQTINNGGPAYPVYGSTYHDPPYEIDFKDMSLRDWFAGMALTGLLSDTPEYQADVLVEQAFELADAMLKEREKEK